EALLVHRRCGAARRDQDGLYHPTVMEAIAEGRGIPKSGVTCARVAWRLGLAKARLQGRPAGHKKLCMAAKPFDSGCGHARDQRQPHRWASIRGPGLKAQPKAMLIPRCSRRRAAERSWQMALAQGPNLSANNAIREAFTFDDVLLKPGLSDVLPSDVDIRSYVTRAIPLNIPIMASAMDTVTEARMAIAMAQAGGVGVIHRNFDAEGQAAQVRQVKKYESGMVVNPLTIAPDATLADALNLMKDHGISGIPVVTGGAASKPGKLVGILTNRDVRFATDPKQKISELMTHENLVTVRESVSQDEAKRMLHQHRIEKLVVVDDQYRCVGLITVKDMEKAVAHPLACKDSQGRLRVAAATTVGEGGYGRTEKLIDAGVDLIVVDTAHGHSRYVLEAVGRIKRLSNEVQVIAGNVATKEGAQALIDAGADSIKVGIGPGSICTTRIVAGVGVPQLTAIMDAVEAAKKADVPVIADGGIKYSGDL